MDRTLLLVTVLAASSACSANSGKSGASLSTSWAVPFLGGLGDGIPLSPVMINSNGPYLFAIDVDSPSTIDPALVRALGLKPTEPAATPPIGNDSGAQGAKPAYVTVSNLAMGKFAVSNQQFAVARTNVTYHGQTARGTIGNDIIDDTLVWSIDRDRSILYLGRHGQLTPAPEAVQIEAKGDADQLSVTATINDNATTALRVSYRAPSMLRPEIAENAKLRELGEMPTRIGNRVQYLDAWTAGTVAVGSIQAYEQVFLAAVAGDDEPPGLDGVLGKEFWSKFRITVDRRARSIWLEPRAEALDDHTQERLRRWGRGFDSCDTPACVVIGIVRNGAAERAESTADSDRDSAGSADAPAPVLRLVVVREQALKGLGFDLLLEAVDNRGKHLPLPYLLVAVPEKTEQVRFDLAALNRAYARADRVRVVDATPFPPPCKKTTGCIWLHR